MIAMLIGSLVKGKYYSLPWPGYFIIIQSLKNIFVLVSGVRLLFEGVVNSGATSIWVNTKYGNKDFDQIYQFMLQNTLSNFSARKVN